MALNAACEGDDALLLTFNLLHQVTEKKPQTSNNYKLIEPLKSVEIVRKNTFRICKNMISLLNLIQWQ